MAGVVGFGAGPIFAEAADPSSPEDIAAAKATNEVSGIALAVDPLVFGDFSDSVKVARNISLTDEEKQLVKGAVVQESSELCLPLKFQSVHSMGVCIHYVYPFIMCMHLVWCTVNRTCRLSGHKHIRRCERERV